MLKNEKRQALQRKRQWTLRNLMLMLIKMTRASMLTNKTFSMDWFTSCTVIWTTAIAKSTSLASIKQVKAVYLSVRMSHREVLTLNVSIGLFNGTYQVKSKSMLTELVGPPVSLAQAKASASSCHQSR